MQPDARRVLSAAEGLRDTAVAALSDLVAVPSISARGEHLEEGARRVEELAASLGFTTELWRTPGAPALFGHLPGPPGSPTLLFYGHYDVQPPEPLDAWHSPPFEPTVRDGAVYGRGTADNKGQLLAHLMAVGALQRCGGMPVSVKILVEGEEEIGSPHLAATVEAHREQLACDLALTADGPVHDDGRPVLIFGVRGLLYLELRCAGANRDVHSGNRGGLVPTPAWELVHALASLRDADGTARVPGFYDDVRPPTDAERRMLDRLPLDAEALLTDLGIDAFPSSTVTSPWEALMFRPTLNICGLSSGYGGPGAKTVVPSRATAKLDVRLVADQTPDAVEKAIRRRLASVAPGFEVERLAAVPPSATPADTPWAEAVASGLRLGFGHEPWRRPRLGGTTPDYVFTQVLGVPSLLVPYANPDMDNHAPNEKLRVDYLVAGIRASAGICMQVAAASRAGSGQRPPDAR